MTALIVDDEDACSSAIEMLLKKHTKNIEVAGIATDGLMAIQMIADLMPDIVFMDVQIPEINGLGVLEKFPERKFEVIFTTGYSQYALNALRLHAVDYLLKPIDPAELIVAVDYARKQLFFKSQLREMGSTYQQGIQITTHNDIIYLNDNDIIYIEAMGNYCYIYNTNGIKHTVSKNIGYFEKKLSPQIFFRCHHSFVVNLNYVVKFSNRDGDSVEMQNGSFVEVSRRYKKQLLDFLALKFK